MSGVQDLLITQQPLYTAATAVYPYSDALAKEMTFMSRFGDLVKLYEHDKKKNQLLLPRMLCPLGDDKRTEGPNEKFECFLKPRSEEQARVIEEASEMLISGQSGIVEAPTGFGKCLGRGTPVLMFSGEVKSVETVVVGDLLMGPDSKPRKVLSVCTGKEPLYKVVPVKGEPWVCNESHILSLKKTGDKFKSGNGNTYKPSKPKGHIVNVSVRDYMQKSATFKHTYKQWRTGVSFVKKELGIPPYILGAWLGDGDTDKPVLTSMDKEVIAEWASFASELGLKVRVYDENGRCPRYYITSGPGGVKNKALNLLREAGVIGNKHIPLDYLTSDRKDRLELLAGLIDTDGFYVKSCFDYVSKVEELANNVAYLARSLGYAAYVRECEKTCVNNGVVGTYFRVCISGDLSEVPCRISRKKPAVRIQRKDPLVTGITLEPLGVGDYFGFEIDGDRLFMLGDFTVTHNTAITCKVIAAVGKKTLIVVSKEDLMMAEDQWYGSLKKFLGLKPSEIGVIRQDTCTVAGKKVVLAMLHSLCIEGRYQDWIRNEFGLIVFDEVHRLGAEHFCKVASMFPCKRRLGLSATPDRKDGKEVVFKAHIGPVRVRTSALQLKPKVLLYKSNWACPRIMMYNPDTGKKTLQRMPHGPGKIGAIVNHMVRDAERNKLLAELTFACYQKGRSTVFFTDQLEHIERMFAILNGMGVPAKDIGKYVGGIKKDVREAAKTKPIMLATYAMMSEGTNIPWLDACVLGTPRSDVRQSIGRVLREYPDKKMPVVIDIQDLDSPVLKGYNNSRMTYYRQIGAEIKHLSNITPKS